MQSCPELRLGIDNDAASNTETALPPPPVSGGHADKLRIVAGF